MALFRKTKYSQVPARPNIPKDLANKCTKCNTISIKQDLEKSLWVCNRCGQHLPVTAWQRINFTVDKESFSETDLGLTTADPLGFPQYEEKIQKARHISGLEEAVITGQGKILGHPVCLGVLSPQFMLGSMGSVVGEKLARMLDRAAENKTPAIIFSASGGARMQESILSLFQMAKVSASLARLDRQGVLYISVMTNPTTGGVSASFAMLGDINIAEPGALIGFAGPRVIQQTIGQRLPTGFQSSDFVLEHGMLDMVLPRAQMRATLGRILSLHAGGEPRE